MAKSKIIKQLVNNEITTKQALERMLILAKDIKDRNLEQWIRNEIQGYEKNDTIPEYRKIPIYCIGTYDVGLTRAKNAPLPTIILDKVPQKEKGKFLHKYIEIPMEMLEQIIKNKEEVAESISPENFQIFEYGTNIQVLSAKKVYDRIYLSKIIEKVRLKVIDILTELEKEFGCLDDLDISIDDKNETQRQEIHNVINVIIQDNHTDNSITMGDENKVSNSTIANNQI